MQAPEKEFMLDLKSYLKEKRDIVDAYFTEYFRPSVTPAVLKESMIYSLLAGGKRLRPILALASNEACGGNSSEIVKYAASLELIHTYSLIHDDLPAMDNDDLRRGKPTNHVVYGEAIAILGGDALLTEAFMMLSQPGEGITDTALIRGIREVAGAVGIYGMVAGQAQDIISEEAEPDEETLLFIHKKKTAALIRASVVLGALLADADEQQIEALRLYGENTGLAFQIIDDILDIEGSTEELGKPTGSDERSKKMTYPALYGIENSWEKAREHTRAAISALDVFTEKADPLRQISEYIITRRN